MSTICLLSSFFGSNSSKIDLFCTFGYVNLNTCVDAELYAEVTIVDSTRSI